MSTVDEIKAAIEHLPPDEQVELLQWASDRAEEAWDRQIESDAASGCMDHVLNRVRADIRAGNVREMP
jgi:hypothetical protein